MQLDNCACTLQIFGHVQQISKEERAAELCRYHTDRRILARLHGVCTDD